VAQRVHAAGRHIGVGAYIPVGRERAARMDQPLGAPLPQPCQQLARQRPPYQASYLEQPPPVHPGSPQYRSNAANRYQNDAARQWGPRLSNRPVIRILPP
jgi:hypothetical protein